MRISDIEINGRMQALVQQRDGLANDVVLLAGKLAVAEARINELTAEAQKARGQEPGMAAEKPAVAAEKGG
jgi:hypothetical protein